jgi:ACR3 family arsenite transporter
MILGVVLGEFVPNIKPALTEQVKLYNVSAPLAIGLIVMMWPILTKVQFERLPTLLKTRKLWTQIFFSLVLNWIVGPFLMLGLAWATLPEAHLASYRTGLLLVGTARCIAMVMIWVSIAKGDCDICACIVIVNSILQMVLYAPMCVLFINILSDGDRVALSYGPTAISVLIYLGIPLAAGVITRFGVMALLGRDRFQTKFLPYFAPLSLLALLYVIIVIFASQARNILDNLGPVFRVFVPLLLYFFFMWTFTFLGIWKLSKRRLAPGASSHWGYQMAVVQSFTGGSNNFELAIAIAVSVYGADSSECLAATIGPLVEVPVLLILSYVALWLGGRLRWTPEQSIDEEKPAVPLSVTADSK